MNLLNSLTFKSSLDISPEVELLLCCARTQIDESGIARIRDLLKHKLDWPTVINLAASHAVLPLLNRNLCAIAPYAIPKEVLSQFQLLSHNIAFRNLTLTRELYKLLQVLHEHGIEAIPFKGPTLVSLVYGDLSLRKFDDIDVLVREQDFLKARELLIQKEGYQALRPADVITEKQEIAHLRASYECSLIRMSNMMLIDLHQKLTGGTFLSYPATFDDLWVKRESVSLCGNIVPSLHSDDLLLYICVHGAKSLWERLGWICDVAEMVRVHPHLDWAVLLERARAMRCDRMLSLGLLLAQTLLDAKLPPLVAQAIQADVECQRLAEQVQLRILSGSYGLTKTMSKEKFVFHFRVLNHPGDRLKFVMKCISLHGLRPIRRLVNPTYKDQLFIPLPQDLYFLYFLIRPIRLLRNSCTTLLQLVMTTSKKMSF